MHVHDLITVERQLGYQYELKQSPAEHYQWICPPCRRVLFGLAQGKLWAEAEEVDQEPIKVAVVANTNGRGKLEYHGSVTSY
jgi:hypothetical protein